jgi:hypothetical protein
LRVGITILEGKTQAAVREVPIHDSAAHMMERRRSADGFLFDGLVAGGPDKKRSWKASKTFGHYTKKLKLGEERQVFHALRTTSIEAMEAADVPESTTTLLIGHKRASLTYGHYSKGERVKLRKALTSSTTRLRSCGSLGAAAISSDAVSADSKDRVHTRSRALRTKQGPAVVGSCFSPPCRAGRPHSAKGMSRAMCEVLHAQA